MRGRIPARLAHLAGALSAALAATAVLAQGAGASVVYDNLPSSKPGNVVSEAFEATQTSEFGGAVHLVSAGHKGAWVTVGMSSWGCQTGNWSTNSCRTTAGAKFSWPITLNVYELGAEGAVGSLVTTKTETFEMPYRPSESAKCTGEAAGAWYDGRSKECFHGKYFTIHFALGKVTLPTDAIVSVSYNTSNYGLEPQYPKACNATTAGCPYDSLNVGLTEPGAETPSIGSDPRPADAYQNTQYGPFYCDGGAGGTGTFRLDAGCWGGYQPLLQVKSN